MIFCIMNIIRYNHYPKCPHVFFRNETPINDSRKVSKKVFKLPEETEEKIAQAWAQFHQERKKGNGQTL